MAHPQFVMTTERRLKRPPVRGREKPSLPQRPGRLYQHPLERAGRHARAEEARPRDWPLYRAMLELCSHVYRQSMTCLPMPPEETQSRLCNVSEGTTT